MDVIVEGTPVYSYGDLYIDNGEELVRLNSLIPSYLNKRIRVTIEVLE